ncbi:MAG: MFS transporter, partial [Nitrososphaera sp.]|uniref:MFS transporter n=1 Tax=Nitrososphaera sp. TaxID=1971748 RepID=UPI003D6EBD29
MKAGSEEGPVHQLGERIDGLNRIPLKPSVIVAISLASFFTYYDVSNYAYISPVLKSTWGVTDAEIAGGASLTILGYVIGAFCITLLADSRGRRLAFAVSILLLGAGSIMAALSQNMSQLMFFRLITGAGIGAELAIASVYISEMSPRSKRGKYTSLLSVLGWLGLTASGPISLSLVQGQFAGIEGWRLVLGLAGAVALVSLPFRMQMPESPRWLLSKDQLQEANLALQKIGLQPLQSAPSEQRAERGIRLLRSRTALRRIIFLSAIWFLLLIPIYSALLLVVAYVEQGYTISQSITINLLSGIGFVAGGAAAILLADRKERKYQVAIAGFMLGVGFVLRGLLVGDYGGLVIAGFIAFFANAWIVTALLTYTAES